ncbi:hypothetical protein GW17_00053805 [Ensete ventricosum]|nr:hypothetical protein GW17_00053805 [Ensete ventricosum]
MVGWGVTLVLRTSWFNCSSWIRAKKIVALRVYSCHAFTSPQISGFRPSIKKRLGRLQVLRPLQGWSLATKYQTRVAASREQPLATRSPAEAVPADATPSSTAPTRRGLPKCQMVMQGGAMHKRGGSLRCGRPLVGSSKRPWAETIPTNKGGCLRAKAYGNGATALATPVVVVPS